MLSRHILWPLLTVATRCLIGRWGVGLEIVRRQLFVPKCLGPQPLLPNVSDVAVGRTDILLTTPRKLHVGKGVKGRIH
jgi:hypothetical protein